MPKKPTKAYRRIVARYVIVLVDGERWGKAYDQGNQRFEEADFICPGSVREAKRIASDRVNSSYYPGMKLTTEYYE